MTEVVITLVMTKIDNLVFLNIYIETIKHSVLPTIEKNEYKSNSALKYHLK